MSQPLGDNYTGVENHATILMQMHKPGHEISITHGGTSCTLNQVQVKNLNLYIELILYMFQCCTYKYLVYPQLANHIPDLPKFRNFITVRLLILSVYMLYTPESIENESKQEFYKCRSSKRYRMLLISW